MDGWMDMYSVLGKIKTVANYLEKLCCYTEKIPK